MASDSLSTRQLIPVSLLTGFLGSGKTTLLNHLVRQPALSDTLVIINEFGAISLDHLLVKHSHEEMVAKVAGGCICCTTRSDIKKALREVTWRFARGGKRQFNRVIIETTGLGDPTPILHTLMTDAFLVEHYRLDGVVTTVDCVNGMQTLSLYPEAVKQAAVADRLVLTKSDLVNDVQLTELRDRLAVLNPGARQMRVMNGHAEAEQLLGLGLFSTDNKIPDVARWLNAESFQDSMAPPAGRFTYKPISIMGTHRLTRKRPLRVTVPRDINRHDDQIRAFCFTFDDPIDPYVFDSWIGLLLGIKGTDVLRVKGIVNLAHRAGPVIIHGVQHIFHPPVELADWPSDDHRTRIVFITRAIDRNTIEHMFAFTEARLAMPQQT
ncbi:CobW family GTP-binding protein [Nitrosovibrio sp. Nv4]|uniref:CobW family GTP-binding protein n=1 Tax=Nitrosovibrio sp. Nv4 TaxID=1945880 RepID=UPI000BD4B924|nr:GTP-binding protein [Nitrosovibrio sp. Nv4]SOD41667.1 GTPase, G3E family [Nitrosovibrio sp. Nv4]